jgi:hypothetical protein
MGIRRSVWRTVATIGAAALISAMLAAAVPSPAAAEDVHCTITITGQKRNGQYTTSPVDCSGGGFTILSTIAVHYVDANFGGSSLTVMGGACNGGWLDLPAAWDNVVSSTWSICTTTHYDGDNLNGSSETLFAFGGNLSSLNDRAESVRYT